METKVILHRYKCNNRAEIETNNPKLISCKLNEILSTCEKGERTIEAYTQLNLSNLWFDSRKDPQETFSVF